MHADPGSLRERLRSSTQSAWRMYCALEVMLPYKEPGRGQPISRQKLTASTIPWHGAAAGLIQDFHAEVRRLEINLKAEITGIRGARRGGSDRNTQYALTSIVNLCEPIDDQMVNGVLSYFDRWLRQAEAVFNPERGLQRLPREPGENEQRCPWCEYQTMRWQPSTGIIICVNPECVTDDKIRPRWKAAYTIVDDEMYFSWEPMGEVAV